MSSGPQLGQGGCEVSSSVAVDTHPPPESREGGLVPGELVLGTGQPARRMYPAEASWIH